MNLYFLLLGGFLSGVFCTGVFCLGGFCPRPTHDDKQLCKLLFKLKINWRRFSVTNKLWTLSVKLIGILNLWWSLVFIDLNTIWVSDCYLMPSQLFSSYIWWDDDDVHFVLDQHAKMGFYSASSLKQQSADRHGTPLRHIILILIQPVVASTL